MVGLSAKVFHTLLNPDDARKLLVEQIGRAIKSKSVPISKAEGYIANEDVYSLEDIPPFDRSEVDGYAVNHESVVGAEEDAPKKLRIVGEVEIGKDTDIEIVKGTAAYISTGAMIPRGADSVVMVEYTSRSGDRLNVHRAVSVGENIAHAGSDFFVGEPLLRRGNVVTPEAVALLASSGIGSISVRRKLRVGIIATGNELVKPGQKTRLGEIYDSNTYYFKATLEASRLTECVILGILRDSKESMVEFIRRNIAKYDIIISSGSTSAGFHDLLYRAIEDLGGKILFHGISIKPGKPTFLASFENCTFIGMPGFPLSAGSVLHYIVIPAIRSVFGQEDNSIESFPLPFRINSERGKDLLLPAIIGRSGRSYPIFGNSGSISRLAYADGFIVIKGTKNFYERDDIVPFFRLTKARRDILFIGSNDPLMERVLFDTARYPTIVNAGSWGGVDAIKLGEADVAGVHLVKNGVYNTFLLNDIDRKRCVMLRGFSRRQGMISRDGITSFKQILQGNMIFVNRNRGSGTRDLIDGEIERELGSDFPKEKIRGYFWEAKSHAAVAKAIKQKRGDVGISIEYYAKILGLKFHKIRDENYDVIMQKEFYESTLGKKFVSSLKESSKYSKEFPGYKFPDDIGELIS